LSKAANSERRKKGTNAVKTRPGFHENFTREEVVAGSSNRSFGLVIGIFLGCVAAVKFWHEQRGTGLAWAIPALIFVSLAVVRPAFLSPLNRLWFRLGWLLHKVMNPLLMAVMFFLVILPVSVLMRVFHKDPLRLKYDPHAATYWIERRPPGPQPDTMRNQF
jgi:hypothetical protein